MTWADHDGAVSRCSAWRQVALLAAPTMGMYLLLMATETISLLCLARHGSARELAGLGLGNLVYNCAALAVGFGFTGSQDTLVTQAFGSNRLELCELYLHRCQVWMCGLFLFSGTFIAFTEPLLLLVGACDRETAEHAGNYTRLMVAGLLGTFQYSALRKFLTAQKLARPGMWVQAISLPLHYLWCTLLVPRYRMRGVGVAMALKGWIDFVLLGLYASWLSPLSSCRHWWRVWKAFKGDRVWPGLLEYFYLAVPCVAMQAVEWWAFELIGLFAGYFHSPEKLAAHVAACNVSNIWYLAGTGAQKATAALIGGATGRNAHEEVKQVFRVSLQWNFLVAAVNASDEVKRRLSGDALQRLEDSAGTVEHAAAEVQEGFDDFLHIARRSFNFTDPGHIVVRNELCTHHQMYFGKVGLTDKYFNAILLGNTAKNAAEEAAKEGCPKHSTWCGPPTEEKDWSQKRKQEYDLLQYCLFACLVIKLGITKLNSCMAKLSDRFISSRSRCDKRWESMFMEVFSSVLFICLQTTLSTMFLLVWRVNSAIATNIPTWGLVSCVGFFFLISTVNELDKFCDLSAKHCNACWTLVFWIGFVGCVLFITIPLVSLTFFNLQFFFQVYQCHLSKKVRSGVPSQLKESSDNCCFFTAIFVLFAVAELVLLACIDWHETERERRPTTMPHKVKGTPYTLVDWKEASEAA